MQVATRDVGSLSRAVGACAGAAVAVFGLLVTAMGLGDVPLVGIGSSPTVPAAALAVAGAALLLLATSRPGSRRRVAGYAAAGLAAAMSLTTMTDSPSTALAILLAAAALALLDVRLPVGPVPVRVADPLVVVAAIIAVVAPLPQLLSAAPEPGGVMSPAIALALLALTGGTVLARPGLGAPAGPDLDAPAGPDLRAPAGPLGPGAQPDARALLQSMNEAVMVLDANHRVIDVNRRWRELTGHRSEDAVGLQPPYPWAPDAFGGDQLLQRVDGTDVPVLATMAAVPDEKGQTWAYVATYVDIGDHKRAEELLASRADELGHANAQLREANSRLESALQFKNDLTAMLTHDVAQPISSIASLAELLTSDWADLPDDTRFELATKIDRNTTRLIRMMSDLQLLFRLDTGSVTARRTPVSIREIIETVADDLGAEGIDIAIDDDVSVLADRAHLWHVVRNLLGNAVKYGHPPIEVRAHRAADRVILIVQDQGAGIPADLVPKLFDRFMRGSGLGLFIVRHLVEANGGTVRYERVDPHGARLIVDLEPGTMPPPLTGQI